MMDKASGNSVRALAEGSDYGLSVVQTAKAVR
jgi:hypothetical protein